jgi:hypothetical protein
MLADRAAEIEARIAKDLGADGAAEMAAMARSFMGKSRTAGDAPPASPSAPVSLSPQPPAEIAVSRSDARAACGAKSDLVNAKIISEACVGLDEAKARETVELLKELGPRGVREALTIRRLVLLDALMTETVGLARAAPHPMLRDADTAQACSLSRAATALDEALERKRGGRVEQRIVVQHVRGGQAVGMVNQYPQPR